MRNALLEQAVRPITDRAFRDAKARLLRLADSKPAGRNTLPREERQNRPGLSDLVAIIEVISTWIVKIDGLFDKSEPEHADIEIEIAAGETGDRGDMVDASMRHPLTSARYAAENASGQVEGVTAFGASEQIAAFVIRGKSLASFARTKERSQSGHEDRKDQTGLRRNAESAKSRGED
jgi:hypothetical protein